MNDHDEERITNALADGLIDGDDTYDGKLTPRTRAANILAAMPKDATPRPTAESPATSASREALEWVRFVEVVPDPAGNTIHDELRTNFLPRIEAEAAALSDPLRDWLDEHDDQHSALREALAQLDEAERSIRDQRDSMSALDPERRFFVGWLTCFGIVKRALLAQPTKP